MAAVLLVLSCTLFSQTSGAPDNRGTEFIIGYMENIFKNFNVELFVITMKSAIVNVTVTAPGYLAAGINESFNITTGEVKHLYFSPAIRPEGNEFSSKAVHIIADDEIIIYGVNKETSSCGAFLGLPTDVLGMEYYTVTHDPATIQSQILIVGVNDSTTVDIKVGEAIKNKWILWGGHKYKKKQHLTVTMNRYDTFHVVSDGDLSGTYISSSKPVSVFSGNKKTKVGNGYTSDHLVEQLTPVNTWGKQFLTVPVPHRTVGDYFKFISSEKPTNVVIDCISKTVKLNKIGEEKVKTIPSSSYCLITADKPILVVQFCLSEKSSSEVSDAMMMVIPPIEQLQSDYTFTTPTYSQGTYNNYFMFVVKDSEKDGLRVDGQPFPANTVYNNVVGASYVGGYINVSEGFHTVSHTSPIAVFGGYVYGQAVDETYGFAAGRRLTPINSVCVPTSTVEGDGLDNDCDGLIDEEICTAANQGYDDDGDGQSDEDCATQASIDGLWSAWGSYGPCSVTCAGGEKSRNRSCTNPSPQYGGAACVGSDTSNTTCNIQQCPIDGLWSVWGSYAACSVTCAGGEKSRNRSCTNPSSQYGGAACVGSDTSNTTCNTQQCPIDGLWSTWGSYGACSVTCAGGEKSRNRSCTNPSPQYGGATCIGSDTSNTTCNTQQCPIDGLWSTWGSYGVCSVTCAGGEKSRNRSCTNPSPQYGGAACVGSDTSNTTCNTEQCPIDGLWSVWGSYGACSVTCAGGEKSRNRSCTNPSPQYGGAACVGSDTSNMTCNTQQCPIDGLWSTWGSYGACSVTCAGGEKSRNRSCTNPSPQYGGAACVGSDTSNTTCNTQQCPIDGLWSTWGSYGACSVTCAGGEKSRNRSCTNPSPQYGGAACVGFDTSNTTCSTQQCPIDGVWDAWGSYGACSVTCAGGEKSRNRSCTNPSPQYGGAACVGSDTSNTTCNTQQCPIDGLWSTWGSYGACSVTCAGGEKSRNRSCTNPSPQYGGAACVGSDTSNTTCNTQQCPIDGVWDTWGSYGACSVTCAGGEKSRNRSCTNPSPQYGGAACVGSDTSNTTCNTQQCPIDGLWSSWGSYGACSVTCAGGEKSRNRSCTNPSPQYGGAACVGSDTSNTTCNTQQCPIDGLWSAWGSYAACSVTCAGGEKSRNRSCTNPSPQYGGAACVGSDTSNTTCNTQQCPIDGLWSAWGSYGACSVTCAGGEKSRNRSCTNPSPQYGGAACVGSDTSNTTCNTQQCPIDGLWSVWGSYGACSVTCAGGEKSRNRSCTNPSPQYGGSACVGSDTSNTTCNTQQCPIDGLWSAWGSYGACSVTCAGGEKSRNRSCTNPSPQYGGATCIGSDNSNTTCNTQQCPIDGLWSAWGSYGACSVTCAGGEKSRNRSCTNPSPQYGGAACVGSDTSNTTCNTQQCPIDGLWSAWGSYGACSVTCAGGEKSRNRSCTNPSPQYGGAACVGSDTSNTTCNTQQCPIDGSWTNWDTWSACTTTCGVGTSTRTRNCTNPAPQYNGIDCTGAGQETQSCNTTNCTVDGGWGAWAAWSPCTVTCGGGVQSCTRVCDNPRPASGGLPCAGPSALYGDCNNDSCPIIPIGVYVQLCPTGWFTCQSGTMICIQLKFRCDCQKDCDDGSDETTGYAGCVTNITTCSSCGKGKAPMGLINFLLCVLTSILLVCSRYGHTS